MSEPNAEPLVYLNGEFVPHHLARLPVWDLGIVQGVTVTEAIRTFRHEPFRLEQHLARLKASMDAVGLKPDETFEQLQQLATQLAGFNSNLIDVTDDLAVILFVTAGESRLHSGGATSRAGKPSVCVYTYPLALPMAARWYTQGLSLAIPNIRHIPPSIIDPQIKYRSRLHWYLADQEVQRIDPEAEALLLDQNGFVTETAKGNLFVLHGDVLQTPHADTTLGGISQEMVLELSESLGLECRRANMTSEELKDADEIWVSSTTTCLVPVTRLNGRPVAQGQPGPLWNRLIQAWSASVGMDIVGQALSAAQRPRPC